MIRAMTVNDAGSTRCALRCSAGRQLRGNRSAESEEHGEDEAVGGEVEIEISQAVQQQRDNPGEDSQGQGSVRALRMSEERPEGPCRDSEDHSK